MMHFGGLDDKYEYVAERKKKKRHDALGKTNGHVIQNTTAILFACMKNYLLRVKCYLIWLSRKRRVSKLGSLIHFMSTH